MATTTSARRRWRLAVIVLSTALAGLAAVLNSGMISGFPPKLNLHSQQVAVARAYINVDLPAPEPPITQRLDKPPGDVATMSRRAELLGRILISPPVLQKLAARCNVPASQLSGLGRTTSDVPRELTEPVSERRASEIVASNARDRVEVQSRPTVPVVDVYTQAPTVAEAECLANQSVPALTNYLELVALDQATLLDPLVQMRLLGPARGGLADGHSTIIIAFLTFLTFFGLAFVALVSAGRLRRRQLARRAGVPVAPLFAPRPEPESGRRDSWPHTNRALPWALAGFIGLIWLTPFNNIALNMQLPIEMRLDRIVLPFVVLIWILALVAGGRAAPRLRMTWIHVALGALLACAFLSVVTDARYLDHTLELALAVKKLPLILSYVAVFAIVASAVRRSEVRSFMSYTLGLALVVAVGMIYEYRTQTNFFWEYTGKLLHGFFTVDGADNAAGLDSAGRRVVRGSAEVPLEAVAMLTMALPIPLVRVIQAHTTRQRIGYGIAICVLVAAMFATYRKSAIVGPIAVVLTLAYFRRRELLRLAPLGLILLVLVTAVSPGALRSTFGQFTRSDAAALPTVSDRAADYDAIRPDVWTHLLLGRGWGTYNHDTYRFLDSEILLRLIETGVIGLIVFVLVPMTVVLASRRTIASREPDSAPIALIGASISVGFLVFAALFDELSFPHAAYIFLITIGLESVILQTADPPKPEAEPEVEMFIPADLEPEPLLLVQEPLAPAR